MLARECHLLPSCPHLVELPGAVTASQTDSCTCSLEVVPSDGQVVASLNTFDFTEVEEKEMIACVNDNRQFFVPLRVYL